MFGRQHVGPLHEHVRWDALFELGYRGSAVQATGNIDAVRNRRTQQQLQGIAVLGELSVVLCEVGPSRIHSGFGLAQRQLSGRTGAEHPLRQPIGFGLALQCFTGDIQQGLIGEHCDVSGRDFRYQGQLRTTARFLVAEVLLQGYVIETSNTAEEVQLVAREADSDVVEMQDTPGPRR
jgi:hypothetical protein